MILKIIFWKKYQSRTGLVTLKRATVEHLTFSAGCLPVLYVVSCPSAPYCTGGDCVQETVELGSGSVEVVSLLGESSGQWRIYQESCAN